MVTSKEMCAASSMLHQNGLTCKELAAKNITPKQLQGERFNCSEGISTSQSVQGRPRLSPEKSAIWNCDVMGSII